MAKALVTIPTVTFCYQLPQISMPNTHQKGRSSTTKRNVYTHEFGDFKGDIFHDAYNLDSEIGDLQANVHRQQPKDSRFA